MLDLIWCTTQVPDTSAASGTQVTQMQHECDTSDTSATRVLHERHECDTSEKFWFCNDTSKNLFSHPYIYYMASERL